MRVFVTGATGFIGSAVIQELLGAGHQVTGLARSDASAKALVAAGARAHRGSIENLDSLRRGAAAADGVIHAAFFHAFTHASLAIRLRALLGGSPSGIVRRFLGAAVETDRRAIETLGSALIGPDRPLVAIFGTMAMKPGQLALEHDVPDANSPGGPRGMTEKTIMGLAAQGIRASLVRFPPSVHGVGDYGLVPQLIGIARKKHFSAYVGEGTNRWAAVHRLDAAHLLRLALENGIAGAKYHGVAEEGMLFKDIANVIGRRLDIPVVTKSPKEAASHFSWLAPFVGNDNPVTSQQTRDQLGWKPVQRGLFEDMDQSGYFKN